MIIFFRQISCRVIAVSYNVLFTMQFRQLISVVIEVLLSSSIRAFGNPVSCQIISIGCHCTTKTFLCQTFHAVIGITRFHDFQWCRSIHPRQLASLIICIRSPQAIAIQHFRLHIVSIIPVLCTDAISCNIAY